MKMEKNEYPNEPIIQYEKGKLYTVRIETLSHNEHGTSFHTYKGIKDISVTDLTPTLPANNSWMALTLISDKDTHLFKMDEVVSIKVTEEKGGESNE